MALASGFSEISRSEIKEWGGAPSNEWMWQVRLSSKQTPRWSLRYRMFIKGLPLESTLAEGRGRKQEWAGEK